MIWCLITPSQILLQCLRYPTPTSKDLTWCQRLCYVGFGWILAIQQQGINHPTRELPYGSWDTYPPTNVCLCSSKIRDVEKHVPSQSVRSFCWGGSRLQENIGSHPRTFWTSFHGTLHPAKSAFMVYQGWHLKQVQDRSSVHPAQAQVVALKIPQHPYNCIYWAYIQDLNVVTDMMKIKRVSW